MSAKAQANRSNGVVRIFGKPGSALRYMIRDFLHRSDIRCGQGEFHGRGRGNAPRVVQVASTANGALERNVLRPERMVMPEKGRGVVEPRATIDAAGRNRLAAAHPHQRAIGCHIKHLP